MILFRAASDVEPGSIQLVLGCNLMQVLALSSQKAT